MTLTNLSSYTILLVDDVNYSLQTVAKMLFGLGDPEVHQAEDGTQALEILQSDVSINFVLSDFKMPGFNGLQLLKAIRTGLMGVDRALPFAMLTGYSDRHLVDMALALDVNAFISKPVSKKILANRLDKMLSRDGGAMLLKPAVAYEDIFIEEAEEEFVPESTFRGRLRPALENTKETRKVLGKMSSLSGKFQECDLARNITGGIDRLVSDAGSKTATRVISFLDDLVGRGILELEDVPDILDNRDVGPPDPNAPAKRRTIVGVWASADSGKGEEKHYALEKLPLGAVLSRDIQSEDGSLFVKKDIPLTQQVISILAYLRKAGAVMLSSVEAEEPPDAPSPGSEPPGVFANFSPTPENDGLTMAFDSEGPPTERLAHAIRGGDGWEKSVPASEIPEGAKLTRDIYTADGRLYMYAGAELTGKIISILRDLQDLENLNTNIWITH